MSSTEEAIAPDAREQFTTPAMTAIADQERMDLFDAHLGEKVNRLRAAVLGANDGIVSTAAVLVGVAGATTNRHAIIMAGLAAVVGGAVSMALGEYVSVSSQRDTERVHGVCEEDTVNPWSAAIASFLSFFAGAILPMLAATLTPAEARVPLIFAVTLLALALTGATSAKLAGTPVGRAVVRLLIGGSLALAITFGVGWLFGQTG